MIKQAVILCGGEGTRLNDGFRFTPSVEVPKPLMEVGGKPFVTYAINVLEGIGFTSILLMVLHDKEKFKLLESKNVFLRDSSDDIDKSLLSQKDLEYSFFLLNGDCYPIMDWRAFCFDKIPRVAVKPNGRDAGCAWVDSTMLSTRIISCSNILGMLDEVGGYTVEGGLHIGTFQGLERARRYMDIVMYGQ